MRAIVVLSWLVLASVPSLASAQPPIVVVGPATGYGPSTTYVPPPAQAAPTQAVPPVPRSYEMEGQLGGMQFHAQITTPGAPAVVAPPPPVVTTPAPQPQPVMIVQPQQPQPQPYYAPYGQPAYAQGYRGYTVGPQPRRPLPRLDDGMDFGARLLLDVLGAGAGFGVATAIGYLSNNGSSRNDDFAPIVLGVTAGLAPLGVSLFGGSMAGGRGRYGGALLGELVGGGLSALVIVAGDIHFSDPWEMIAAIAGPALLGAIIGFEAQHAIRTARLEDRIEREGLEISGVSVAPTSQGNGAMIGLTGTF